MKRASLPLLFPQDVAEWLMDAAMRKKLNVISCHLVSSRTGEGGVDTLQIGFGFTGIQARAS